MNYNSHQQATKIFSFACAHLLSGHLGLCKNLHGHNYKVEVTFEQHTGDLLPAGPSEGMVCDFKDIKNVCNRYLFDAYDHALVIDQKVVTGTEKIDYGHPSKPELEIARVANEFDLKMVYFPGRPTAELMSKVFYERINEILRDEIPEAKCVKVRVWETDTSFADYFEDK